MRSYLCSQKTPEAQKKTFPPNNKLLLGIALAAQATSDFTAPLSWPHWRFCTKVWVSVATIDSHRRWTMLSLLQKLTTLQNGIKFAVSSISYKWKPFTNHKIKNCKYSFSVTQAFVCVTPTALFTRMWGALDSLWQRWPRWRLFCETVLCSCKLECSGRCMLPSSFCVNYCSCARSLTYVLMD